MKKSRKSEPLKSLQNPLSDRYSSNIPRSQYMSCTSSKSYLQFPNSKCLKNSNIENPQKNKFSQKQILVNQILKVLKLRLCIENIKLDEEKIIEIIQENLNLIDIRYFKVSSLNVFVDDLIVIIKSIKSGKEKKTILDFNRKEYIETQIDKQTPEEYHKMITSYWKNNENYNKKKIPMKFGLGYEGNPLYQNKNVKFYLDGNNGEISSVTDCDIEIMKEKILEEVTKERNSRANNLFFGK